MRGMNAAPFSVSKTKIDEIEVYQLRDTSAGIEVSVAPSFGMNSYDMRAGGRKVFWTPPGTLGTIAGRNTFCGNPFLWPWANRIDGESYWVNGKKYTLNPELGNYRRDGAKQPIHGLLAYSKDWQVTKAEAGARAAVLTARHEFWRYPGLMAQFPFAHTVEMTYRLAEGALEVALTVENLSREPLPLAAGFHPYFGLEGVPRDEWQVTLPVRERVLLSSTLVPTGERAPSPHRGTVAVKGLALDDVFTGLERDARGRAVFRVAGGGRKIEVEYGPKYPVAVVYAPPGRDFICFEPMTAPTNGFNLAQRGQYAELQSVAPGAKWSESFWIRAGAP
jgi:aldose 1-epimerase